MAAPLIRIEGLEKTFLLGDRRLEVLRGLDLDIAAGELVALTGPSGAGKSTFLHLLGTLDVPTRGRVLFEGVDVFASGEEERALFRSQTIGFVFQSHHLLPEFTALENAMMPALICPAASSSGWQSRAPCACPRGCSWPTSPPATWIRRRPRGSTTCSSSSTGAPASPRWWSRTTSGWRARSRGGSGCWGEGSREPRLPAPACPPAGHRARARPGTIPFELFATPV